MRKKVKIFYKGDDLALIVAAFFIADRGYKFRREKRATIIEKPDLSNIISIF